MSHKRRLDLFKPNGQHKTMAELKLEIVKSVTIHCRGNISDVGRFLKMGRSTIYKQQRVEEAKKQIGLLETKLDKLVTGQEILWNWAAKRNKGELK